jgi:hypothetical protein
MLQIHYSPEETKLLPREKGFHSETVGMKGIKKKKQGNLLQTYLSDARTPPTA